MRERDSVPFYRSMGARKKKIIGRAQELGAVPGESAPRGGDAMAHRHAMLGQVGQKRTIKNEDEDVQIPSNRGH